MNGHVLNSTVIFRKINEVYCRIECEEIDYLIALREKFSFFESGYKFHPAYKAKQWDGKKRLINQDGTVRLGLWKEVQNFCANNNMPFALDPQISSNPLDFERFDKFVQNLNVHSGGEKIDPYDYQKAASHWALEQGRGLLLSPTSSGKSLIQYMLIRAYEVMMPGEKILIVVPTVGLVTQMRGDFDDYSSEIEWDAMAKTHGIKAGVIKDTDKDIIVSTYQSLQKSSEEYFHQFSVVMVDEVHAAASNSVTRILDNAVNAKIRIGLTGTLDECETNEMILQGMFGPVKTVITTKELMDQNKVAQLRIHCALLQHPQEVRKHMRSADRGALDSAGKKKKTKADYKEEIAEITKNSARNKFIMRFAASLPGNTVIMINQVEHGENLHRWMKEAFPGRKIYLYTGATKADEREEIRQAMEKEDGSIIIGSLGVLSTGISIKRLHNMIFAHPSKSRVKVLQSVGRLLRKSKFGNEVQMYDLVDDFSIGKYINYTLTHGKKRVEFYSQQQFNYSVHEVFL